MSVTGNGSRGFSRRGRRSAAANQPAPLAGGAERREEVILRELARVGSVSVEDLAERFAVSPITVRRDLGGLEQRGLLRRTHGGAVSVQPLLYEPFRHDSSFNEQVERHAEEKRRIALAAADLIRDGEVVAVTPGTTTTQVTRSLHGRRGLTVITNTVNVAMELSVRPELNVFVTGGFLRGGWFSLVGPTATHALDQFYSDKVFIGVDGIHADRGLTAHHPEEAATNRVMIQKARQRIVVADRSKLGVVVSSLICQTDEVHVLITDQGATDAQVAPFRARGIDVRRV
jgi:DeoR family transcriptional regulator, aga operon transcriptional repressor